jgi:uncharacterized Ntn-hydrolase superfamily protein
MRFGDQYDTQATILTREQLATIRPRVTFSIVGFDHDTGDLGVAVASKFLAVGAVVPWAQAGVGAVATQSYANTSYGPRGLELLGNGLDPAQTIERLTGDDIESDVPMRQVGIVDARGRSASFSGPNCHAWAGGCSGACYAAQGNILAGPAVVEAMAHTFEGSAGPLAERLLEALAAGQAAGGDSRGQQSAALLVVRDHAGYGGWNDRYIDARVDDHRQPIDELRRVVQLWRIYFETPNPRDLIELTPALIGEIQALLGHTHTGAWDAATRAALRTWAGVENLEERLHDEGIDPIVLRMLREHQPR